MLSGILWLPSPDLVIKTSYFSHDDLPSEKIMEGINHTYKIGKALPVPN